MAARLILAALYVLALLTILYTAYDALKNQYEGSGWYFIFSVVVFAVVQDGLRDALRSVERKERENRTK